jgi:hypothetical protein
VVVAGFVVARELVLEVIVDGIAAVVTIIVVASIVDDMSVYAAVVTLIFLMAVVVGNLRRVVVGVEVVRVTNVVDSPTVTVVVAV